MKAYNTPNDSERTGQSKVSWSDEEKAKTEKKKINMT